MLIVNDYCSCKYGQVKRSFWVADNLWFIAYFHHSECIGIAIGWWLIVSETEHDPTNKLKQEHRQCPGSSWLSFRGMFTFWYKCMYNEWFSNCLQSFCTFHLYCTEFFNLSCRHIAWIYMPACFNVKRSWNYHFTLRQNSDEYYYCMYVSISVYQIHWFAFAGQQKKADWKK